MAWLPESKSRAAPAFNLRHREVFETIRGIRSMECETLNAIDVFVEEIFDEDQRPTAADTDHLSQSEMVVDEDADLPDLVKRSNRSGDNFLPALLSEEDMARKVLGCGKRTLWRYAHSGVSPRPIKVGGLVRYRRDEYLAWIEAGCPRCDGGKPGGGANRTKPQRKGTVSKNLSPFSDN
jgi:predicted DNA-binding transcriptional regulator AlpA